jgi:hypothetical protein
LGVKWFSENKSFLGSSQGERTYIKYDILKINKGSRRGA